MNCSIVLVNKLGLSTRLVNFFKLTSVAVTTYTLDELLTLTTMKNVLPGALLICYVLKPVLLQIVVPLNKVKEVNIPAVNKDEPHEKNVKIVTHDYYDFRFMGTVDNKLNNKGMWTTN